MLALNPSTVPTANPVLPTTRRCSRCRNLVPSTQQLKTCNLCREKSRIIKERKRRKEREGAEPTTRFSPRVDDARHKRAIEILEEDNTEPEENEHSREGCNQMQRRDVQNTKGKVPVKRNESKVAPTLSSMLYSDNVHYEIARNALTPPTHPQSH